MKNVKSYWLLKTEPSAYSIDDLKKDKKTLWTGVRNYQARNFMRDDMSKGDMALFYHSHSDPDEKGIVGVAKITKKAAPDPTQFDKKDSHYDPKSKKDNPMWFAPEVAFVKKFKEPITLKEVKLDPKLDGIMLSQPGSRLSIQPVSEKHFKIILALAK